MLKIGVIIESFKSGLRSGLESARAMDVDGVQFYAAAGETHYSKLKGRKRSELKHMLDGMGLELAAVCGDFGAHGFQNKELNIKRVEETKRIMELTHELGAAVVSTHVGVIPENPDEDKYRNIFDACLELGSFAEEAGVTLAIETGPEPAQRLRNFIDGLGFKSGISVNFDPANLVMVCREDVIDAVNTLAPFIVHTHAKDGKNLQPVDPSTLYACFAGETAPGEFDPGDYIKETPLGEGDVPFPAYLQALQQTGYENGYLTIEREAGDCPKEDIREAVGFLRNLTRRLNEE